MTSVLEVDPQTFVGDCPFVVRPGTPIEGKDLTQGNRSGCALTRLDTEDGIIVRGPRRGHLECVPNSGRDYCRMTADELIPTVGNCEVFTLKRQFSEEPITVEMDIDQV